MKVSLLIVTKNRSRELEFTLTKLRNILDLSQHELLILIDGCLETKELIAKYEWVNWNFIENSVGASPARNLLYQKATGDIFIGLDDDAHPISNNFIDQVTNVFLKNPFAGIIAFQEIKGLFSSDQEALENRNIKRLQYKTNDFVGCGFAVKKEIYDKTRGFPVWIDIYGEESCLSMEVLDLGSDILYNNEIIINHRVDRKQRLLQGKNYFRFEKQLKNSIYFYLVYYPLPLIKIIKLLIHNFKKYALTDRKCFVLFFKAIFITIINLFKILKFRKPISNQTQEIIKSLRGMQY